MRARHKKKIVAATVALTLLVATLIAWTTTHRLHALLEESVAQNQNINIRTAASIMDAHFPAFHNRIDKDGTMRLELTGLPIIRNHDAVDLIGETTGETATLFLRDTQDSEFWRRTTNIRNADGERIIDTPLGKDGSVHPVVFQGQTYTGEADILGDEFFTLYEPVFRTESDDVLGVLYVGLRKSEFNEQANTVIVSVLILIGVMLIGFIGAGIWFYRQFGPRARVSKSP